MKSLLLAAVLSLIATAVSAQVVTPVPASGANRLVWDVATATLADAQSQLYRLYKDNLQVGPLVGVVCAIPTPVVAGTFNCGVAFPAGDVIGAQHSVVVTAALADGSLESAPSNIFTYILRVVPVSPRNLKAGK